MTPKKNSLQTWSLWGSELSLLLLLWKLVKETGTQIDVSICFTEYSQLSSLAAELWTPCCPLFFNSACMTTWMNIPLGTGFDTHTHTHKLCFIWHRSCTCIESLAGFPGADPLECQWRPVFLKGSWPWKQALHKCILLKYLPSPSPLPHKCFQSKGHFYDFRNLCCLSLLVWILVLLLFGKCEVQCQ